MIPTIGILSSVDAEGTSSIFFTYQHALEKNGALPLLLPYVEEPDVIDRFIELCDGFFFTGGVDIHPKYFGEEISPNCGEIQEKRDTIDLTVARKALESGKPILGICRGIQLLNVALGGSLYQDLPSERPSNISHRQAEDKFSYSHSVTVCKDSPLFALLGEERIPANSFHHQAIKALGRDLAVMAYADDGVIEGVYSTGAQYLRAYQWHPERLWEKNEANKAIFTDFIEVCKTKGD